MVLWFKRFAPVLALVALALGMSSSAPLRAEPQTAESFLGHRIGADRKLADYGQISKYFEILDAESNRLTLHEVGKSTLGQPMLMAVISSESNLRNIDRYREIARQLANPRGLSDEEAQQLMAEGKSIVLVACSIHANEIGASQMAMEWAHDLVTSEDPKVIGWLDDVIVLLFPSINPDGTNMIVDYYRRYVGTEWEGGRLPWLYHHYAGHDNNRDWFMLNLSETRAVNRVLSHDWFPQVFMDMHQMGAASPRMFVPPYSDPHSPRVHPLQWRLLDLAGTHMALKLEEAGKSGVIHSYAFDAYWPGGTKNTASLKNVVGILTEVASVRVASPVYVDPNELRGGRKGLPDYKSQINFPNPWPGGWWRLRDVVEYELIAANSLLETCSRFRAELLNGVYTMSRDAVRRGGSEAPFAYVVPPDQHDPVTAVEMIDIMRENGVEVHRAKDAFATADGRSFAAGSFVFLAAQPYRPFLIEMMERQRFHEIRQGPDTRKILRPYDVTAWTLPLLMGVNWARVDQPFDAELEPLAETPWPTGQVVGEGSGGFVLAPVSNHAVRAINTWLQRGVNVFRTASSFTLDETKYPPGTFLVGPRAATDVETLANQHHLTIQRVETMPVAPRVPLRAPRVALYKPWRASMDEGWTRMVLDRYRFDYESLDNTAVRRGDLNARYDVIIIPDLKREVIVGGGRGNGNGNGRRYAEPYPTPYAGGIGSRGTVNLRRFVERGGTLICLGASSEVALAEMNLPVSNVVDKVSREDFALPGTLVQLLINPEEPIGYGMPESAVAYYTNGPVFATTIPGSDAARSVVARFPAHADDVLASGWAAGHERVTGRAAVVTAGYGKGMVVLFGLRPQHRGQTHGTFKLLFNAIYLAGMK